MKTRAFYSCTVIVLVVVVLVLGGGTPSVDAQVGTAAPTANAAATLMLPLVVTSQDGMPSGMDSAVWNKAFGVVTMTVGNSGTNNFDVELAGLIANGVYSAWWANTTPSTSMGPLGIAPADSFKADGHGNVSMTLNVPSNNPYQWLQIVYQADGATHGTTSPGQMGTNAFTQLSGKFPGPGGTPNAVSTMAATAPAQGTSKATVLFSVSFNGIPPGADKAMWAKQIGVAVSTPGNNGTDSVILRLGRLVPNSLYTAWWMVSTPTRSTAILGQAPNNGIKPNLDGWASLTFDVPSNNTYQRMGVFFQADGNMPGPTTPGVMGSIAYVALSGAFPGPAGANPTVRPGAARPTQVATAAQ